MRLTDERGREIERQNNDWSLGVGHFKNNVEALLADREALLAELASCLTAAGRVQGFLNEARARLDASQAALAEQLEWRAKDQAEIAKLRRMVGEAEEIAHCPTGDRLIQQFQTTLLRALADLEPDNVPDATDDKG